MARIYQGPPLSYREMPRNNDDMKKIVKRKIVYFSKPKPQPIAYLARDKQDKTPPKRIYKKKRSESPQNTSGSPLFPGKLIPVYMYRHGRKLPVTSFRVIFKVQGQFIILLINC